MDIEARESGSEGEELDEELDSTSALRACLKIGFTDYRKWGMVL